VSYLLVARYYLAKEDCGMEPVTAIVLSLALGAKAAAGNALVGEIVKDAYAKVKGIIASRFSSVSLSLLETAPESEARRAVITEDLAKLQADKDAELVAAARKLIEVIREQAPATVGAIGVNMKDVEAANIRLRTIMASGTGVNMERVKAGGDIEIKDVQAGLTEIPPKKA
jgi:hypothetical protein